MFDVWLIAVSIYQYYLQVQAHRKKDTKCESCTTFNVAKLFLVCIQNLQEAQNTFF